MTTHYPRCRYCGVRVNHYGDVCHDHDHNVVVRVEPVRDALGTAVGTLFRPVCVCGFFGNARTTRARAEGEGFAHLRDDVAHHTHQEDDDHLPLRAHEVTR